MWWLRVVSVLPCPISVPSPMLMPMRFLLGGATLGELLGSLAILAASTAGAALLAARIYRVGILMYGKRPTISSLLSTTFSRRSR